MAIINPSLPPGSYFDGKTIGFTFDPSVVGVSFTKDASPPSISKYIAYDQLTPPNPFLAVTEDGRGRVVYDGGFPKFYNGQNPTTTTFSGLTPAAKYLYNALNWVANPTKVAAGNKKVLFLGDTIADTLYSIKSITADGFKTTIETVCQIAGFTPSFLNIEDFNGTDNGLLNPGLGTLEQYACVVL